MCASISYELSIKDRNDWIILYIYDFLIVISIFETVIVST